jgi:Beta/Gamma crystallin
MFKTLVLTTSLAAGLLMIDVAQPVLMGATAEAAPRKAAPRVAAPRIAQAPRVQRVPRVHVARPHAPRIVHAKPERRVVHVKPVVTKPLNVPKVVRTTPHAVHATPNLKPVPNNAKPNFGPPVQNKPFVFKKGPGQIKKQLALGPGGLKPGSFIKIANKPWPIHKGPHKIWWKTGWKTFVPFTAIGVVLIGGAYYYPDAYVSVARPYCAGLTPEGCQLNWQEVPFEGGGSEWQCVTFCPRPNLPPPPKAVAMVVAPPAPAGGRCEVEIFADPKFAGLNAPSDVDQPRLADNGWKNEISSIQVKAGTWDFFSEDEYAGDNMRLPPGPYPELGPQWTKHIGSFMCVQGG